MAPPDHHTRHLYVRLDTKQGGGMAVFSLVEANQFKELTHLSLHFRPGNDPMIKVRRHAHATGRALSMPTEAAGV